MYHICNPMHHTGREGGIGKVILWGCVAATFNMEQIQQTKCQKQKDKSVAIIQLKLCFHLKCLDFVALHALVEATVCVHRLSDTRDTVRLYLLL